MPNEDLVTAFKRMESVIPQLNEECDRMQTCIDKIDAAMKKIATGLEYWHKVPYVPEISDTISECYVGYAKVGQNWGIAIQTVDADNGRRAFWLFRSAPRNLRSLVFAEIGNMLQEKAKHLELMLEQYKTHGGKVQAAADSAASTIGSHGP